MGFLIKAIDLCRRHELPGEARRDRIERKLGSLDDMGKQRARVFIADRDANRGARDARFLQGLVRHFGMTGESGAKHDRVGLSETHLKTEGWLEQVEEGLERVARNRGPTGLRLEID